MCWLVVKSGRSRLLDVDNIPPKFIVDGIVHSGLLPDDNPHYISAEVIFPQVKVKKDNAFICVELVVASSFGSFFLD